jgi:hypothetical protein
VFVMAATIPSFLACWFAPFNIKEDDDATPAPVPAAMQA